jgi:predicted ester cyclase
MTESPETVVRDWIALWNEHAVDRMPELAAPGYVHHALTGRDLDLGEFQAGFADVVRAFPDITYRIDHLVADEDRAAVFLVATGTHGGDYFLIAPTGKKVTFRGAYHCRVTDGLIAEDWDVFDLLSTLFTLGAGIRAPNVG